MSSGHAGCVQLILETAALSEADHVIANHEDNAKEAPLHVASRCGNLEILELLVKHGANLYSVDSKGRTCLHCAVQSGHNSCLRFLLQVGGDELIEERDDRGLNCLHIAAKQSNLDCAETLLQGGIDIRAITPDGVDVLQLARIQKSRKLIDLLLQYGYESNPPVPNVIGDGSDLFQGLAVFNISGGMQSPSQESTFSNSPSPHHGGVAESLSPTTYITNQFDSQADSFYHGDHLWFTFVHDDNGCSHPYFLRAFDNHSQVSSMLIALNVHFPSYSIYSLLLSQWEDPRHAGIIGFVPYHSHDPEITHFAQPNVPHISNKDPSAAEDSSAIYGHPSSIRVENDSQGAPITYQTADHHLVQSTSMVHQASYLVQSPNAGSGIINGAREPWCPPMNEAPITQSAAPFVQHHGLQKSNMDACAVKAISTTNWHPSSTTISSDSQYQALDLNNSSRATNNAGETWRPSMTTQNIQNAPIKESLDSRDVIEARVKQGYHQQASDPSTKDQANPPMVPSLPPLPKHAGPTSESAEDLDRYKKMLNLGVPLEAILHKMRKDGVNSEMIDFFKHDQDKVQNNKSSKEQMSNVDVPDSSVDVSKYSRMISVGVPLDSVVHKMVSDGMSNAAIEAIQRGNNGEGANCRKAVGLSSGLEPPAIEKQQHNDNSHLLDKSKLKKYTMMVSIGVPFDSVIHKMMKDGMTEAEVNSFKVAHDQKDTNSNDKSDAEAKMKAAKDLIQNDTTLTKYKKMAAVGVPSQSIVIKMRQDGVDKDKISAFEYANGLSSSTPSRSPLRQLNLPAPPAMQILRRRTSVTMQKIHWKPVSQERVENSLWASATDSENVIDDSEVRELENLFGAKKPNPAQTKRGGSLPNKSKAQKISLIDVKRSNNIAISLAQFKAFQTYDDMCKAVVSLDSSKLSGEQLQNMMALLPTQDEMRKMKEYKGGCDGLGRAENFFLAVTKIPRYSQKLSTFTFVLQFTDNVNELRRTLVKLETACTDIVNNGKLAGILKRLLAIGNLVNEGAGNPNAAGITMDSLLKTANKTGTDGKTRVIDVVVANFLKQDEDGTSIEFWSELRSVSAAARIDMRDCKNSLRDIQTGMKKVNMIIETEERMASSTETDLSSALFLERSNNFVKVATKIYSELEAKVVDTERSFETLCMFFAEDPKSCRVSERDSIINMCNLDYEPSHINCPNVPNTGDFNI